MIRHSLFGIALTVIAALSASGCSNGTTPGDSSGRATSFQISHDAKAVFYVVYDNPDDRPLFGEAFRFRVDSGYIAGIDETKFIEMVIPQGDHEFSVDEISWAGTTDGHYALRMSLKAGSTYYVTEHIRPDDQPPVLLKTDGAQGAKDILTRTRVCPC